MRLIDAKRLSYSIGILNEIEFKFLKETGYQIKYVWEDDWKEFRDGSVEVPNIQTF